MSEPITDPNTDQGSNDQGSNDQENTDQGSTTTAPIQLDPAELASCLLGVAAELTRLANLLKSAQPEHKGRDQGGGMNQDPPSPDRTDRAPRTGAGDGR